MPAKFNRAAAIVVAGVAVFGGSAVAIAASESSSNSSQAIIDDAANRLGISSDALNSALKSAAIDQLEAAVKDGKLTQAQADEITKRIQSGQVPPVGVTPGFGDGHFGGPWGGGPGDHGDHDSAVMAAAARYLGITEETLRNQLMQGTTLAQLATKHGKPAQGLYNAMAAAAKTELDQAVKDGHLTQAQEDAIIKRIQSGQAPALDHHFDGTGDLDGHGPGGPRLASFDAAAEYLGVSEDALRSQLMSGKSLAEVAKAKGRSVSGLEQAMVAASKAQLEAAVKKGYLTAAQAKKFGDMLARHIDDLVQGHLPNPSPGQPFGQSQPGSSPTALPGSAA
jgi:predicted DNA-binding protein (UPF0251 family)